MRLLEIGPGQKRLGKEWETLDCVSRDGVVDYIANWGYEALPFRDDEFGIVFASHVAEHIPWWMTVSAFQEVHRILSIGGSFEVWVPDFRYIIECYLNEKTGDNWRKHNPDGNIMLWVAGRIFTYGGPGGNGDPNWHRACFDRQHLTKCLLDAGFVHIEGLDKPRGYDHGAINLGLRGVKS